MARVTASMAAPLRSRKMADRSIRSERSFYVVAACMMLIVTALAFRFFILHGKAFGGEDTTRQIVPLVVIHGLAMFGWIILFLVQSILIWNGNRRLHMVIGPAGAVLAAAIVVLGATTAGLSVHFNPQSYQLLGGARFFLAVMLGEMLAFGTLVAIGMLYRRRAEIHRPMMLLATVEIMSGSLGRCPYISHLAIVPPLYAVGPMLLFGALLFLLRWAMTRVPSRWYVIGYLGITAAGLISVVVGRSAVWSYIAGVIVP
jgi:hypothetical protein